MELPSNKRIKIMLKEPTLDELKKFTLSDVIQCLSSQMRQIFDDYKQIKIHSYEIYILMCGFAMNKNYKYNIIIHNELLKDKRLA